MSKLLSAAKGLAIAIIVLGVIHNVATFTPLIMEGLACLSGDNLNAMTYMSLMCGTSLILSGLVLIMLLKWLERNPFLRSVILVIGIFLGINGLLSVIYMINNPFAWIALTLNMAVFIITLRLFVLTKSK